MRPTTPESTSKLQDFFLYQQRRKYTFNKTGTDSVTIPNKYHSTKHENIKGITCTNCNSLITKSEYRISIDNQNSHSFFNPYRFIFNIVCFSEASGCTETGLPCSQFSWFPPYKWQICFCSNCTQHIGWKFIHSNSQFYGLILEKIRFQ